MGLTTASPGSLTIDQLEMFQLFLILLELLQELTCNIKCWIFRNSKAPNVMGLTGLSSITSVGAITPADVMGLTGLSCNSIIRNSFQISTNPIVDVTGLFETLL